MDAKWLQCGSPGVWGVCVWGRVGPKGPRHQAPRAPTRIPTNSFSICKTFGHPVWTHIASKPHPNHILWLSGVLIDCCCRRSHIAFKWFLFFQRIRRLLGVGFQVFFVFSEMINKFLRVWTSNLNPQHRRMPTQIKPTNCPNTEFLAQPL